MGLGGADLCDLKLNEAKLEGANMIDADLTSTYLIKADLKKANLTGADLTRTVMSEADLRGADFKNAEFNDTYLCGSNLKGALNLTCEQLELSILDKGTILPDYIRLAWINDALFNCEEC